MSWKLVTELKNTLAREKGYYLYAAGARRRMALAYPNSYRVGMSNLGFHIIYDIMNRRMDTACERFFLPERASRAEHLRTNTPLMSLETQTFLSDFPLIGFDISFEMDYFNILDMLSLGKVKVKAAERGDGDPIVIAGGPCATFNPEPLSPFIDAFIIGEGEETMMRFMDAFYAAQDEGVGRRELLMRLAHVDGVYVPSLYDVSYHDDGTIKSIEPKDGAPSSIKRQWVKNLDEYPAHTIVVTDDAEFDMYLIETARGCGRHCRFCMAGYCYRRPRNRSLDVLRAELRDAKKYHKRIGLMGAAISDYPEIDDLCRSITGEDMTMSVASFRADSVTETLVESLVGSGMKTLTLAPEAGSARMRAVINKGIEEEHLFHTMDLGMAAGIRRYRLYIMIGLPYETENDILAVADLARRLKDYVGKNGMLTLSVNPFIPKPFTPFQWLPMEQKKTIEHDFKLLKSGLKGEKGVEILMEPIRSSYIQGVLARGDRRVGEALYAAHVSGGAKSFRRTMKERGLDPSFYLYREREDDEIFPWEMLDMLVTRKYLFNELVKAKKGEATIKCFDNCHRCGVC